jgi:PIN domain-containing protein
VKEAVYLETTIFSYLASHPSRDLIVAAHQQLTREWWQTRRHAYRLFISQAVVAEISAGDPDAVRERSRFAEGIPLVPLTDEVTAVADTLMRRNIVPGRYESDAFHIAFAASAHIELLLTWNCAHIANPHIAERIRQALGAHKLPMPTICTPVELAGT